jgi:hypothetical protein
MQQQPSAYFQLDMPSLPSGDTIFNYNVCIHTGKWTHWDTMIKNYTPPEITPLVYSSLLIPNVSSIRTDFLIDLAVNEGRGVLLMGEQGWDSPNCYRDFIRIWFPRVNNSLIRYFAGYS